MEKQHKPIHLMAKPAGPVCNLNCTYCFYLEKSALFDSTTKYRMSNEILEAYIRRSTEANAIVPGELLFAWQGGEPTLMGLDFFQKALALEKQYAQGKPISNTLQTNGTLLTDEWCEFLATNKFLVGLSLDGPEFIHDYYRIDKAGHPTYKSILRALKLLQKHGVEYNVLACVANKTAKYPLEVYQFFKEHGVQFVQFTPIVERAPQDAARTLNLKLGLPPDLTTPENSIVTPWTVDPTELGNFYCAIFDEWIRHDVGKFFIMNFEWALFNSMGGGDGAVCHMSRECGNSLIVEHNGDIYSCDHFVYPQFKLGNVLTDNIRDLAESQKQQIFGARKEQTLPNVCKKCNVRSICRGGCPKQRFNTTACEPGLNYLCEAYKKFYSHIAKYTRAFQTLVEHDEPCELIMQAIDQPLIFTSKITGQKIVLWAKNST